MLVTEQSGNFNVFSYLSISILSFGLKHYGARGLLRFALKRSTITKSSYVFPCIPVVFRKIDNIKTHTHDTFSKILLLVHQVDVCYQCLCIRKFPKTTFMSPIVLFTVTFELTICILLKVIVYFHDICSKFSLWWSFSNGFAFQKQPTVTPKWVIQWKEPLMTIKECDFPTVHQHECMSCLYILDN
jgi:hypothetical protein